MNWKLIIDNNMRITGDSIVTLKLAVESVERFELKKQARLKNKMPNEHRCTSKCVHCLKRFADTEHSCILLIDSSGKHLSGDFMHECAHDLRWI